MKDSPTATGCRFRKPGPSTTHLSTRSIGLPETDKQPTAEQSAKLAELRAKAEALETRRTAAVETEQRQAAEHAETETGDGEQRERRELRSRSNARSLLRRRGRWPPDWTAPKRS